MVNIINFRLGIDQFDQMFDDFDDVLFGQHADIHGGVEVQFLVDTIAAHFAEVVPFVGEEEFLERGACGLFIRRGCGAQLEVDVFDGLLFGVGRVLLQGVGDDRIVLRVVLLVEKDGFDTGIGNHVDMPFFEAGFAFHDQLGSFDVDNLTGGGIDKVLIPVVDDAGGELAAHAFFKVHLGGFHLLGNLEDVEDVFIRLVADGAEQGGDRKFLLTVDEGVHHVVDVGGELHP